MAVTRPQRLLALTRPVSAALGACELSYVSRGPIDVELARTQHAAYEDTLRSLCCEVRQLAPQAELADAVFIEDTAVVLDEMAIVTRPGASSRRPETAAVAVALRQWRETFVIEAPGTLDGGDVVTIGRHLLVGRSRRSNDSGFAQLRDIARNYEYRTTQVTIGACLHLKSALTCIAADTLLVNPAWVDTDALGDYRLIATDPGEPHAANTARVGGWLVHDERFAATRARLQSQGFAVAPVPASELARAEGGVSCCSLVFAVPDGGQKSMP